MWSEYSIVKVTRMLDDEEFLLGLPEDPELQLVELEALLRREMERKLRDCESGFESHSIKIDYVTKLMGYHDALGLRMLTKPLLKRGYENVNDLFDEFTDDVNYWTTQIRIRHAQRLRPIRTTLYLDENIRKQIHVYISRIRETIAPIDLKPEKKEALFSKLNSLADEVDRDRTKAEALTALALEVASAGGQAAQQLKPVQGFLDSITKLFGKAKEMAERLGLPGPSETKRLEGPPKRLSAPENHVSPPDFDDESPF